jgi:hypothetical protein
MTLSRQMGQVEPGGGSGDGGPSLTPGAFHSKTKKDVTIITSKVKKQFLSQYYLTNLRPFQKMPGSIWNWSPSGEVPEACIGFGRRIRIRVKNDPQKLKKVKKFHVLKCWMFSFRDGLVL